MSTIIQYLPMGLPVFTLIALALVGRMKTFVNTAGITASTLPIDIRLIMQIVVSALVLVAGLGIILFGNYGPDDKKWAYGAVGLVLGYWLKAAA